MKTPPLHTRPFNLEHARAGAPFCGAEGQPMSVFVWDRKHPSHPIVAMEDEGEQEVVAFRTDGTADHGVAFITSKLVMTPLGMLGGKPVFVGDELVYDHGSTIAGPTKLNLPGLRWPAPAPVYPQTRMTYEELCTAAGSSLRTTNSISVRCVANAALRHAIDAGQVKALPFPGVMVSFDLTPVMQESAIKAKLVEMGWTPPGGPTKEAYDQCSRDLGEAERLLESLGYRSAGNGEWSLDAP